MSKVKCYNCNEMGHYARDCFSKKKGIFHAFVAEANGVPHNKRARESNVEQSARQKKQVIVISALIGTITNSKET